MTLQWLIVPSFVQIQSRCTERACVLDFNFSIAYMSSFSSSLHWTTRTLSNVVTKRTQLHSIHRYPFGVRLRSTTSASSHKTQADTSTTSLPPATQSEISKTTTKTDTPGKLKTAKIMDASNFGYMANPYTAMFNGQHPQQNQDWSQQQGGFMPQNNTTFTPAAGMSSNYNSNAIATLPHRASITKTPNPASANSNNKGRSNSPSRSAPSAASGGIPNPTQAYLQAASFPPLLLPHPRRILVVIDLNGTLLFRPSKRNSSSFIQRPHAKEFLSYCLRTFFVAIWSSSKPENVKKMVDILLPTKKQRSKLMAVWGRDKFGLSPRDYAERTQCYKRLTKIWEDPEIRRRRPDQGVWSQRDTVLIDDSLEKARSEPYNLVQVPEFFGGEGGALEDDNVLPQVHDYLNTCSQQADVSAYMRQSPFKLVEGYRP